MGDLSHMKHLVIINLFSGKNELGSTKEELEKRFAALNIEVEFYETKGRKDATNFLREYFKDNEERTRVYACGGDGTVFEVVNGIINAPNAELAIYPIGTGNDFVKTFKNPEKLKDIDNLINGEVKEVDLTKLSSESLQEDVYSINVINFGFDAIVGAMGNYYKEHGYPKKAKDKGLSPYDYALKNDAMKRGRFNNIEVVADGEKLNNKKLLLATLAQGQYVGGQFHCSPKSVNTDGLIDVVILKTMTLIGLGMIIGPYTRGEHLNKKRGKVIHRRAKEISFYSDKEFDVCVDGEMFKGQKFTAKIMEKRLKLVYPL